MRELIPLFSKAAVVAARLRSWPRRLRSRGPPKSIADLDDLPTPLFVVLGLVPAAGLAWLAMRSPLATALLVALIPAVAAWQGRRVRVVWEHGIPAEVEAVAPLKRRPVAVGVVDEAEGTSSADFGAAPEPGPPYRLHDPLIELMALPGGTFWMGSDKALDPGAYDDELPRREVGLAPYAMAIAPITRGIYRSLMQAAPGDWGKDKDEGNLPANDVSWEDGVRFCNTLSRRSGLTPCYREAGGGWACDWGADGYRLPTEAEWEYACRAGTDTPWFWGVEEKDADRHAWYAGNSGDRVHPVREKVPNRWGLHDMAGNVREWCWDWYADTYDPRDRDNPRGPAKGEYRMLRGGSFIDVPRFLRSAVRRRVGPGVRAAVIGFRCVRGSVRQPDR
jgi:sulfatase modifying factor 1